MNKHYNQKKAYMYGFFSVFLWSTVASAFKITLRYFSPIELLFYSAFVSMVVLLIIIFRQNKIQLFFSYDRNIYLRLALLGFLNPFLYYLVLFKAYDLLPAQEAQPINYTWALTLSYLSFFVLKHKLNIYDFLAGLICYLGILIISTQGNLIDFEFSSKFGVFLAFLSTVIWAIYWIYSVKLAIDPIIGLFVNFLAGFIFILFYILFSGQTLSFNLYGALGSVYIGCFEMGITYVLWLNAMKLTDNSSKIANLIFISPFISLIFIHFFVGEKILASTFIGLILIVFGLLLQQKKEKKTL